MVNVLGKTVLFKGRAATFDVTGETTEVYEHRMTSSISNLEATASEGSSLPKRMGVSGPNRNRRRLISRLDDRRRLENRGRLVNRNRQRLSRRRGHSSLRRAGLLLPRRGRRNRRNHGRGRLRCTGNRIGRSRWNHGRGRLRHTGNRNGGDGRQLVVTEINGRLI